MKFSNLQVVFQEVPDEISIAISVSGCDIKCNGCHSAFTWDQEYGEDLNINVIKEILKKYKGLASCFLFYGGEWETNELISYIDIIKENSIKVCLYTGLEIEFVNSELLRRLDYIKTGKYIANLGGLDQIETNQSFYKVNNNGCIILEKLNHKFCNN